MPRPRKSVQPEGHVAADTSESSKVQTIKSNELLSLVAEKCRYLGQVMTTSGRVRERLMEEQWEQKINDRLLKYPHIPGPKLFSKLSSECWNEIYQQNEETQAAYKLGLLDGEEIRLETRRISAEIKEIEEKLGFSYTI